MNIEKNALDGVYVLTPEKYRDERGYFCETFSKKEIERLGLAANFVQDNHSFSRSAGTIRGLHFQNDPHAQCKLVRCISGAILDVAVDLRRGSPLYKKWISVELSEDNGKMIYIPRGFAHGFLTLCNGAQVEYKVDSYYCPQSERTISYDDPDLKIDWGCSDPILSPKDARGSSLACCGCNFKY